MPITAGDTLLNKYRILRLIDEGGMARVWLAEEVTFDGRQVAIKEPKAGVSAEDAADLRRRFQQEISLTAALMQARAPNVVPAWTVEPLDGGLLLAMQFMSGGSLGDMLKQPEHTDGLPIEQAVAIALDALQALDALHRLPTQPVHRDVKPSNILFDDTGRAHLADFGLAQLPGVSGRSRLAAGAHPATPLYAAPEQLRSPEPLLPAADIFALGCVLWEMLTGQCYKRSRPGTAPSQLRPDVPARLEQVVMKSLAEDPWERWQKAEHVANAIRAGSPLMIGPHTELGSQQPGQPETRSVQRSQDAAWRNESQVKHRETEAGNRQALNDTAAVVRTPPGYGGPQSPETGDGRRRAGLGLGLVVVAVLAAVLLALRVFSDRGPNTIPTPQPIAPVTATAALASPIPTQKQIPSATWTEPATNSPLTATPTRSATRTPLPIRETPKATATKAQTATSTPTATTASNKTPATATPGYLLAPVLIAPPDGASVSVDQEFRWRWDGASLREDERFDWRLLRRSAGEDVVDVRVERQPFLYYRFSGLPSGEYYWAVRVIRLDSNGKFVSVVSPESTRLSMHWNTGQPPEPTAVPPTVTPLPTVSHSFLAIDDAQDLETASRAGMLGIGIFLVLIGLDRRKQKRRK